MHFVEDRRGRVPFALVGVLLLLGSTAYAAGLAAQQPPVVDRSASEAMDAATRDARPALRAAISQAARDAAAEPVTRPANSTVGRGIDDQRPFVDALRIRIAVAAREQLSSVERRRGTVRTNVSLPVLANPEDARWAMEDVVLDTHRGNRTLEVTLRNVTVRATRENRLLSERVVNVTIVADTPVLALHERTDRFERHLDRGPLAGPGLGRGLTARLYPVTWARAYGRYGGAPIQNVLANRHVELSTNTALLDQQRTAFGTADPDAARGVQVATATVGIEDVLGPDRRTEWAKHVLDPNAAGEPYEPPGTEAAPVSATAATAADTAYLDTIDGFDESLAGSYRVSSTLTARMTQTVDESRPEPSSPGDNWSLAATSTTTDESAEIVAAASGRRTDHRRVSVVEVHSVTRLWVRPDGVRRTERTWRDRYRVDVAVASAYAPQDAAPNRETAPVFERGGALETENLQSLGEASRETVLDDAGGATHVALDAVRSEKVSHESTASKVPSTEVREWVAADLRTTRQRVANVSVELSRRQVASGVSPASRLAAALRSRRAALIDAPVTYDGVTDRARIAARAAFVDAVIEVVERRAAAEQDRTDEYLDTVSDRTSEEVSSLVAIGAGEQTESQFGSDGAASRDDRRGYSSTLRTVPEGSPAYLTLSPVDHETVPSVPAGESVHPLAARNVNWFAAPYGDVAEGIVGSKFSDSADVSLRSASQTLVAANRTADIGGDEGSTEADLEDDRRALVNSLRNSLQRIDHRSCVLLWRQYAVERETCRDALEDARDRWPSAGHRGLAVANGSYAEAIGAELLARDSTATEADEATVRLRVRHRELAASRKTSVPAELTNRTADGVQTLAREASEEAVSNELENVTEQTLTRLNASARLPTGLPVAPVPGYWYATVNAWTVTVHGEYQRFAVRTPAGGPDGAPGGMRYVRDGSNVTLDVDGDGVAEELGRNERIAFETKTIVLVAVPPGPPGVGDVDGDRNETSAGWP